MEDWMPTFLAAAGEPNIKEKLLKGHKAGGKKFNVHLDGYNLLPYLTGKVEKSPRKEMFYFTDDGQLSALRYNDWKMMFSEQREHGFDVWQEPYVTLRLPKLFNLRRDPFERAEHESIGSINGVLTASTCSHPRWRLWVNSWPRSKISLSDRRSVALTWIKSWSL